MNAITAQKVQGEARNPSEAAASAESTEKWREADRKRRRLLLFEACLHSVVYQVLIDILIS